MALKASDLKVGETREEILVEDLKRTQLVMYAGASGDYNPLHTDDVYTREAAGYPGVFAHGMLPMAYLGRFLTQWAPQTRLRRFSVRFAAITPVGARLSCTGKIVEITEDGHETLARLEIGVVDKQGEVKLAGDARVALA